MGELSRAYHVSFFSSAILIFYCLFFSNKYRNFDLKINYSISVNVRVQEVSATPGNFLATSYTGIS